MMKRVSDKVQMKEFSENVLECEIYFGSDSQDGTVEARDGYLDDILEGARNTNLPHEYISGVLYPWKS